MRKVVILLVLYFCLVLVASAHSENLIPEQIEWKGKTYSLVPWNDDNKGVRYGDFDGDGSNEAIASFRGIISEQEYPIPQPFHLIYKFVDRKPVLVKTITTINDQLGEVRIIDLDKGGQKEIAIFCHGGAHYTDLSIYTYRLGEYRLIFHDGSACGIELKDTVVIPHIRIGRANWEEEGWSYASDPLWEIYAWDGENFVYKDNLSSSRRITEKEENQRYIDKTISIMDESKESENVRKMRHPMGKVEEN